MLAALGVAMAVLGCAGPAPTLADWPRVAGPVARNPAHEARVAQVLAGMTLEQKVGQMTQPEIAAVTPDEVRRYRIGSVLNGGGSAPGGRKRAGVGEWLALAEAYHAASMATDLPIPVPLVWGTDAVHGHNNVFGATVFPHNIGLGATHDEALVAEIGAATGRAVRATGIGWVFAPTLAVARDDRWGRTYESFSEDPATVRRLGAAAVRGLQGRLGDDTSVLATAKHFIGDGGTDQGRDQGINRAAAAEMIAIHSAGYQGALGAGVQTVMASFHSWHDGSTGIDHGKVHGSRYLLTELLKQRMGFDGFVVSDWNGIGQVPGCRNDSCARAINAGIDMVMVPQDWKAFIANTVAQVRAGEIPMARIDDAVSRILRVKLRAGLFDRSPAQGALAGQAPALQARELARRAVRQSLVLLKNNGGVLPLARGQKILVVGKSADSLQNQTGGWTLSWQGTGNTNADFPAGDTVLAGIRAAAGAGQVDFSESAEGVDPKAYGAVIAVIGETPYAEGNGDIPPSGTLRHSSRHPEDLAVLQRVSGRGVPVVTVLLSGRPLHTNDLINRSDAFVAAWLPGTEGAGVADLLLRGADGRAAYDFTGRLSFSWPRSACQTPLNIGDRRAAADGPLFPVGQGLTLASRDMLGPLDESHPAGGCGAQTSMPIFNQAAQAPYSLHVGALDGQWPDAAIDADLGKAFERPGIRVDTVQINTQQDAKRVEWSGPARVFAWSAQAATLAAYPDAALVFDAVVSQAPQGRVTLGIECARPCGAQVDLTPVLRSQPLQQRRTLKIPLACLAAAGADLSRVDVPFSLATARPFSMSFTQLRVQSGAARDADALSCTDLPRVTAP